MDDFINSQLAQIDAVLFWFEHMEISTTVFISIISIPFLIFLSALFSASETAITGASRARIHHKASHNDPRAYIAEQLIEQREKLIAAILLGNNLVNILASVLATAVFLELFGEAGILYATVIMTVLIVTLAELLPKTLALLRPDNALLFLSLFARGVLTLLGLPAITAQAMIGNLLKSFRKSAQQDHSEQAAREELRGAIDLHHMEGTVVKDDKDMLDSILDLDEVNIDHVMVHRTQIIMVNADEPTSKILKQILAGGHTRIPLWRNHPENIIGILHTKDVLSAFLEHEKSINELNLAKLARDPWFVLHKTSLRVQLNAFLQGRSHCALVVDEYGELMGFVTLEDILEEIVGEISDEHDKEHADVRKNRDGSIIVDGAIPIRALNRALGWHLPDHADTSTLAGLVIKQAGIIPSIGDGFDLHGIHIDILARRGQQITSLRVRKVS